MLIHKPKGSDLQRSENGIIVLRLWRVSLWTLPAVYCSRNRNVKAKFRKLNLCPFLLQKMGCLVICSGYYTCLVSVCGPNGIGGFFSSYQNGKGSSFSNGIYLFMFGIRWTNFESRVVQICKAHLVFLCPSIRLHVTTRNTECDSIC